MINIKLAEHRIKVSLIAFFVLSGKVWCEDQFSIHALELDNPGSVPADLSQFSVPGGQLPGVYLVDIYVNGEKKETKRIKFRENDKGGISPELTPRQFSAYGVNVAQIKSLSSVDVDSPIIPVEKYIPGAVEKFVFSEQRLDITIPQALVSHSARGYIPPEYWDEGIPAIFTSYDFNGSNTSSQARDTSDNDSYFLNLHSGFNIGAWRFRNYSTWNYDKSEGDSQEHWNSINSWMQRDIKSLKGQFIVGDTFTSSDMFDSFQFTGAQLVSDDDMLPDSQRGFAPVIRGIAQSNAKVTIKQGNNIVYQTNVSPGPFVIDDLYPASSGGDLIVTVTESDGSERTFTQAFSSVPVMQREGHLKYTYTVGKYRSSYDDGDEPNFAQTTLFYGLPHDFTLYGGTQYAQEYNSYALGVGSVLGILGSISADITEAHSELSFNGKEVDKNGQSYRFQYMKDFQETSSTVAIAGYRYSTSGFYSFNEATDINSIAENNSSDEYNFYHNKKNKFQIDFTQELMDGEWGSLSIDGYQQNYWGEDDYDRSISIGYNSSAYNISYGLNYTYSITPDEKQADQQLAFNISIPLGSVGGDMYVSYDMVTEKHGDTTQQVGLSGTALEGNNLSYSVSQGYENHTNEGNGQLSADYKGSYGSAGAGYNYDHNSRQINYNLRGSMVAHQYGITFGQPLSGDMSSIVLVRAPGADDVRIKNNIGVETDWRGYTIVPYVSAYRKTGIQLTTEDLGDAVDIESNASDVIPTEGAIVLADFKTHLGARAIATLIRSDGTPVPFGATVTVNGDDKENIVGDDGQVYLTGLKNSGQLNAVWGKDNTQACHSDFDIASHSKTGVATLSLQCK